MKRGFTLVEVLLATVILSFGLAGILGAMSQAQSTMIYSAYYQTAQEVMDLGDMAYPLSDVEDPDQDLDITEQDADDLWKMITDEPMTKTQKERYDNYTWEREALNKTAMDKDELSPERLGGLYIIKLTVGWGSKHISGEREQISYTVLWRNKNADTTQSSSTN